MTENAEPVVEEFKGPPPPAPVEAVAIQPRRVPEEQRRFESEVRNADFEVTPEDVSGWTKRFWLSYFWKEAVGNAKAMGAEARMVQVYDELFPQSNGRALRNLNELSEESLFSILTSLLKIGFAGVKIHAGPMGTDARGSNMISQTRDGRRVMKIDIGWRGETRRWSQIVRDEGTKRQVDLWEYAAERNMTADWHPFSAEEYADQLWFRQGASRDNCKYSVISVGLDFDTVTAFPLINEIGIYPFAATPYAQWQQTKQTYPNNNARVKLSDGSVRDMPATQICVYMFLINGPVLDTNGLQAAQHAVPFPEKGIANLDLDNIYGWFEVARIHHGFTQHDGHTVFIRGSGYAFENADERKLKYGGAIPHLEAKFHEAANRRPFSTAWADRGRADAAPLLSTTTGLPVTITALLSLPPRG